MQVPIKLRVPAFVVMTLVQPRLIMSLIPFPGQPLPVAV